MKVLLIFAACFAVAGCYSRTVYSVSEVFKAADAGLRGKVEVAGIYDFHCEEDTIRDSDYGPMLQLDLLPLLKDVPIGERNKARVKLGNQFHGQRVVISGELKKGRFEGWSCDETYVSVSKLEKEGP